MKKHSISKLPKYCSQKYISNFIKINNPSELMAGQEIFKIDLTINAILGVDFYNTNNNKQLIDREIKQNFIFIKSI